MDVSIIIVNYNTRELLSNCLDSIVANTTGVEYEVIVVDNASSDGSVKMLETDFPWVQVIESKENLGFGRANNLGTEYAKGEYYFLLNSDTVLLNNTIQIFHRYASEHPEDGVLGSILLDSNNLPSHSFSFLPSPKRLFKDLIFRYISLFHKFPPYRNKTITEPIPVEYITGADLWIPAKVYREVGGFDPDYFLYFEETDLQKRIHEKGIRRTIIPGPQITHLEGGSDNGPIWTRNRLNRFYKSQKIYSQKHFSKFSNAIMNITYWPLIRLYIHISQKRIHI